MKLDLNSLKVQSFVTDINGNVFGGVRTDTGNNCGDTDFGNCQSQTIGLPCGTTDCTTDC